MNIKKLTNVGVMTALAVVLMIFIKVPYPGAPYLLYDFGDTPILIISFLYGPIAALISTIIGSFLMAIVTGEGGVYGVLMHILATGTFVSTAGFIYNKFHNKKGAIIALISGAFAMTAIMIPANLIVTPIYTMLPREEILKIIIPVILPFNITKSLLNAVLTVIIYKRIANFLRSIGLLKVNQSIKK